MSPSSSPCLIFILLLGLSGRDPSKAFELDRSPAAYKPHGAAAQLPNVLELCYPIHALSSHRAAIAKNLSVELLLE